MHDRFRSLPVWRAAPLVGAVLADTARYLLSAALVLLVGVVMGFRPGAGPVRLLAAVALVVTFALALSWLWLVVGLLVRSATAVTGAATVVLFPLTLASNVFVRPVTMPGWLRDVVQVNPVTHLVSAERMLLSGRDAPGDVLLTVLAAVVITAVCVPVAVRLYGSRS